MYRIAMALSIVLLFTSVTVHADWPMTAANPQRTSWVSEQVTGGMQIEWALPMEAYMTEGFHLVAANSKIYAATSRGLYALNAVNGSLVWSFDTQVPLGEAPTIVGSTVYVPCLDRRLVALNDADGSVTWIFDDAGAGFSSNPLVLDGTVYVGCRDGYFYAVNASNGNMVWRYPDIGQAPIAPIRFSPAYYDGVIYFAASDCYAYAIDASNGTLVWKSAKMPGQQYQDFWPVVYRDKVVFTTFPAYRRSISPGARSFVDPNNWIADDYHRLEHQCLWPDQTSASLPIVSSPAGTWHHGNQVLDASLICEHYENDPTPDPYLHAPWRRTLVLLNQSNGSEYTMDVDSDGHPDYAPIAYYAKTGMVYPPMVCANDDVIYVAAKMRLAGSMGRGNVVGWDMGTPYLSVVGLETASDEPEAISGGGNSVYQVLCCCRIGSWSMLTTTGSGNLWTYGNEIYDLVDSTTDHPQLPGLDVMWWGRSHLAGLQGNFGNHNGIYHDHGYQNPLIPYNGRVYVHRSNAVICYGPGTKASAPLPILQMDDARVDTLPVPTVQDLTDRLEREVQKIVNAGNLNPGYYCMAQLMYDQLKTHFENPGDTLMALCRAYPHVSGALQAQLSTYLQNQFSTYFNPTMYSRKGWSEGVSRNACDYPPEVAADMATKAPLTTTVGRASFAYPPNNFYALWKYAQLFPSQALTAYNQAKTKLQVPCPGSDQWITRDYWYEINMYITGYIGFLKLQEEAGMTGTDAALRTQVQNELNRLKNLRVSSWTKDSPFTTTDKTLPDGNYRHRTMNIAANFLYMCPESAEHMRQNLLAQAEDAFDEYNWVGPYWFISRYPGSVMECAMSTLYDPQALFEAKAWVLQEPYEEIVKWLDAPGFLIGDLFYINNLVTAIEAPHSGPTIEPDGGGTYVDPVTVSISMPSVPDANIYYTLDGSEPNDSDIHYTAAFELTANTTLKAIAYSTSGASGITTAVFVIDTGMANQPPTVDAGDNETIQMPVDTVSLWGTVHDDTLAFPILDITTSWSKVSGPGTVTFDDDEALATTAQFSMEGVYVLKLTAYEGILSAYDDVTITVEPKPNEAPFVNAGSDQQIVLPVNTVSLSGFVSDDGLPNPPAAVGTTWSKLSGPGEVIFGNAWELVTTATFSGSGTYVLQLDANDGEYSGSDTLAVTVYPPLQAGAVAHLKLDDGGGTVALDSSGNGNNGTVGGGAVWSSGVANGALTFDGVNDLVTIASSWMLDSPKGTWSLWVKTNGNWGIDGSSNGTDVKGNCVVLTRHNASASREGAHIVITDAGKVKLQCKNETAMVSIDGVVTVTNDSWHHIAITYDRSLGGALNIYVDGQPDGSGSSPWDWSFNDQDMLVADSPDIFWEEYAGQIDDIQIYNVVLSATDIAMLYNNAGSAKKAGDINSSGAVDEVDLGIMASQWLQTPGNPSADICPPPSGDGVVDMLDLAVLANNWLD